MCTKHEFAGQIHERHCTCDKHVMLYVFPGDFTIEFEYVSKNGTGTGEIVVAIDTVDKIPLGKFAELLRSINTR